MKYKKQTLLNPTYRVPEKDINIKLNDMIELDFKTKKEILSIRKKFVNLYPELLNKKYYPSKYVFGSIEDKKPWWGILGHFYYGNGLKSIEGMSEESRFIANPFLLVGLKEPYSYNMQDKLKKPEAFPPTPSNLVWHKNKTVSVDYNVSDFFKKSKKYKFFRAEDQIIGLIPYNALDLGLNYIFIDKEKSKNIHQYTKSRKAKRITHFLHTGSSCGYPGGGTNQSPRFQYLDEIKINETPAKIALKLWKVKPKNPTEKKPDLEYIIHLY